MDKKEKNVSVPFSFVKKMTEKNYESIAHAFDRFVKYYYNGKMDTVLKLYNNDLVKFYNRAKDDVLYNVIFATSMDDLYSSELFNYMNQSIHAGVRDEYIKFLKANKVLLILINLGINHITINEELVTTYAHNSNAFQGFLDTLKFKLTGELNILNFFDSHTCDGVAIKKFMTIVRSIHFR